MFCSVDSQQLVFGHEKLYNDMQRKLKLYTVMLTLPLSLYYSNFNLAYFSVSPSYSGHFPLRTRESKKIFAEETGAELVRAL